MDGDGCSSEIRPRTSSFRSTQSGFVHPSGGGVASEETPSSSSSSSNHYFSSPVKHLDNQELSSWRDLVCSLDAEKEQADLYSKPVRSRHGIFGGNGEAITGLHTYSRPSPHHPTSIPIINTSSMDLLFDHLKKDSTEQMALFLREKACIVDEDEVRAGPSSSQGQGARGVKRPATVVDGDSQSDGGEDELAGSMAN